MRNSSHFAGLIYFFSATLIGASLLIWLFAYKDWTALNSLLLDARNAVEAGARDGRAEKNLEILQSYGLIGDSFGKFNFAISSLAFLGVAFSVFFQAYQLRLQKEDALAQKADLEEQKDYLKRQNLVLQRQSFETSFYNLLNLFIQTRDAIEFEYKEPVYSESPATPVTYIDRCYKGSAAFQFMYSKLEGQLKYLNRQGVQEIRGHIQKYFELNGNFNELNVDQYFRVLSNFLNLIDETSVGDYSERLRYFTILRSIFFESEFSVILLYSLTEKGKRIFELLSKYGLAHGYTQESIRTLAQALSERPEEFT